MSIFEAKSTIGLQNMVIAPLLVDTEEQCGYGIVRSVMGIITAEIAPNNTEPDNQYADDGEFDTQYADPELKFTTTLAGLPLGIQKMILRSTMDSNGVLISKSGDKPPYFAIGFKAQKSNGDYRFVWLYKVRAKPIEESYGTKQGTTVDRKTASVEWTAIKRTYDNASQAMCDMGRSHPLYHTFLTSVYEPLRKPSNDILGTFILGTGKLLTH